MDTKALRQKILDLAIRGQLVPQDPNDEPASVLLDRIRAEKQKMVKEGKLKAKDIKNDSVICGGEDNLHYEKFANGSVRCIEDEIPFDLPEGWAWSRIKNIASIGTGATPLKSNTEYYVGGKISWITSAATCDNIIKSATDYITELAVQETNCQIYPVGTLVVAMYGEGKTRGQISELGIAACTNQACAAIQVWGGNAGVSQLVKMFFSYNYENIRMKAKGGQQPNLNQSIIAETLIPIPPENEIMRLLDFSHTCLNEIQVITENKERTFQLANQARTKILDLAIRGKLVPQDPNDEPASVLLERIRAEKEELIKQGKIKRDKKESVIFRGEDNSYYLRTGNLEESLDAWQFDDLPETWEICCLGDVCDYGDCINVNTADIGEDAWILDLEDIEKDTGTVLKKVTKAQRSSVSTKHRFHSGQVLYSKLRPCLNKVVLSDDEGYCTSEILPLEFDRFVLPEYARYYLMSATFLAYADRCSYGVKMPRMGTADGKKAIFPLPPLAEQERIVKEIERYFCQLTRISEALA